MKKHIEDVSVKVEAVEKGQHGGLLREAGTRFDYSGKLINGEFPKWCHPVEKFKTKFGELSPSEQDEFKKGNGAIFDAQSARKDIEAEVRREIEAEERSKLKAQIRKEMEAEMKGQKEGKSPAPKKPSKADLEEKAEGLGIELGSKETVKSLEEKIAKAESSSSII